MATLTLYQNKTMYNLIHDGIPETEGSEISVYLLDGDTINMNGHNLIVDMITCGVVDSNKSGPGYGSWEHRDISAYNIGVYIQNTGNEANIEFHDWSGIRFNQSIPNNVNLITDDVNYPIPIQFPGIDTEISSNWPYPDDPYRTNLTANARIEIQTDGSHQGWWIGGNKLIMPTSTRNGVFYALSNNYPNTNQVKFDHPFPLHKGDYIASTTSSDWLFTVEDYDETTNIVTLNRDHNATEQTLWTVVAGGIYIKTSNKITDNLNTIIAGTLNLTFGKINGANVFIQVDRLTTFWHGSGNLGNGNFTLFFGNCSVYAKEVGCLLLSSENNATLNIENLCTNYLCHYLDTSNRISGYIKNGCIFRGVSLYGTRFIPNKEMTLNNLALNYFPASFDSYNQCLKLENCRINNSNIEYGIFEKAGNILISNNNFWYHNPATLSDVTWKYKDIFVPAGSSINLMCSWQRYDPETGDSSATKACVVITDTAEWWPTTWQTNGIAKAIIEFTSETSTLQIKRLTWTNTSTQDMQIRVWECVTGSTSGGYLKTQKISGGIA